MAERRRVGLSGTCLTSAKRTCATGSYANPYRNLLLQVQWTCVSGCSATDATRLPKYGFWDGGAGDHTFKLRALFPQPLGTASTATYRWATTCTRTAQGVSSGETDCSGDTGLNSSSTANTVTVARSDAASGITNPLYLGGGDFFLSEGTVSEGGQLIRSNIYLSIPSTTPFYWLGDTAWVAPIRGKLDRASTPNCAQASGWNTNDWKCYLQDRASRGFTVIQIAVPGWWMKNPLTDANGLAPFVTSGGFTAWSKWNPAFWQAFEDKVQYANEQGFVVVVVGLMEPSYQYLATNSPSFSQRYPPIEDAKTFARSLAARLAGNVVILSPGFDSKPDGGTTSGTISYQIRTVGAEIDATLPRHRLGNHFGGSTPISTTATWNDYQDFHGETWLDFHLFQSGQAMGNSGEPPCNSSNQLQRFTNRARQIPLSLRTYSPRKGSVNAEAIYDDEGAVVIPGQSLPANAAYYVPYRVRQTAYLSTLSGAFGYTVGVYGLWDWGRGNDPYQPRAPRDSVGRTSVVQMQHLSNIFRAQRWWWLAPTPTQIVNNISDPNCQNQHLQMVVSRDLTRRSTVAYLPDNAAIQLQLDSTLYPSFTTTRWSKFFHNPRTGGSPIAVTPTLVSGTTNVYNFPRPSCTGSCNGQNGDRDWVLVLTDTTAGAPLWAPGPTAEALQSWSVYDPDSRRWTIRGRIFDATGKPVTKELILSDATKRQQRLPQSVRGTDGNFFVVWEADGLDGDGSGIFGRLVDKTGQPLDQPFQINSVGKGRQSEPIVTADGLGRFLVVWTSGGGNRRSTDVLVRRFSSQGEPLEDDFVATSETAGPQQAPLISADPSGNFVVGWMSEDPARTKAAIFVRRFDAQANPLGEDLEVETSATHQPVLERLEMDARGNFQVIWNRPLRVSSQERFATSYDLTSDSLAPAARLAAQ